MNVACIVYIRNVVNSPAPKGVTSNNGSLRRCCRGGGAQLFRHTTASTKLPTNTNLPLCQITKMPSDDLLDHAKSDQDFYALLGEGIHPASTEKEISRAYRRAALKSHPDQNPDDPNAVARFHALQIAYDVLSDPAAKAAYDNARAAREARRKQTEMLEGRRRAMKEDLERRESSAFKRKRTEVDAEERFEQELRRLAEDGRRRRKEREEALLREQTSAEQDENETTGIVNSALEPDTAESAATSDGGVPEVRRTVKVRWRREGSGISFDKASLERLFGTFGEIQSTLILRDRKVRLGDGEGKRLMATGFVVFKSIVGAHAAVQGLKHQSGADWSLFESVEWAEGKEPDCIRPKITSTTSATTSEPAPAAPPYSADEAWEPHTFDGSKKRQSASHSSHTLYYRRRYRLGSKDHKPPAFSFSSSNLNTVAGSSVSTGPQNPSLEEITMIRLRNAERKRLEEQIRNEEAENTRDE